MTASLAAILRACPDGAGVAPAHCGQSGQPRKVICHKILMERARRRARAAAPRRGRHRGSADENPHPRESHEVDACALAATAE
jgi:hypothetical protein